MNPELHFILRDRFTAIFDLFGARQHTVYTAVVVLFDQLTGPFAEAFHPDGGIAAGAAGPAAKTHPPPRGRTVANVQRGQAVTSAASLPFFWHQLVRLRLSRDLVGGGLGSRRVSARGAPTVVVALLAVTLSVDAEESAERLLFGRCGRGLGG